MNSLGLENLKIEAIKSIYQTFISQAADHTGTATDHRMFSLFQTCRLHNIRKQFLIFRNNQS